MTCSTSLCLYYNIVLCNVSYSQLQKLKTTFDFAHKLNIIDFRRKMNA